MQYVMRLLQFQQLTINNKRLLLPLLLIILLLAPSTYEITKNVLADAYWQVSAYVAATLIGYHFISFWLQGNNSLNQLVNRSASRQILFASLLGALPGCGGAIIVVTQFIQRKMSFGALVAVLTATMGDAAFLLLATKPTEGLIMIILGTIVGAITGILINHFHGPDFLLPEAKEKQHIDCKSKQSQFKLQGQGKFWRILFIPSFIVALMASFQLDLDKSLFLPSGSMSLIGMILAISSIIFWAFNDDRINELKLSENMTIKQKREQIFQKAAQDTNFVTSWVIIAFLSFELTIHFTGWDLNLLFSNYYIMLPLMAALIGLLPGCGPQILVTSLYIQGSIPFSSQIANGLSNDGDALFPAIALAPKAAMIATIYSIIPALLCGYGYFLLFE